MAGKPEPHTHYDVNSDGTACDPQLVPRAGNSHKTSTDANDVTCGKCKNTKAWRTEAGR
jgi:ribosomal protein S27AE